MASNRSRVVLLSVSLAVVLVVLGGGVFIRAGAAEGSYRQVITFSEVLSLVIDNYVDPVDQQDLLGGAYEGLLASLDDRGAYLTAPEVAEWKKSPSEPPAETGLSVLKSGAFVQVVAVAPGSPADRAGLLPGDQIRRVDGASVRPLSWDQVVRRLNGKAGTTVRLSVVHPRDAFRRDDVDLSRTKLDAPKVRLEVDSGVAVLRVRDLARFDAAAAAADLAAVRTERGARKLLVDLRNLAAGSPKDAAAAAGLFVAGPVFVLKDKQGKAVEEVQAKGEGKAWPGEIAVLVNGGTAGGGEALARLLQSRRDAKILGEGTFGLGPEPKLVELPDGAGLLIPAYLWETTAGGRWSEDGVKPDTEVRAEYRPDMKFEDSQADQLRRAVEELSKEAVAEAKPKAA